MFNNVLPNAKTEVKAAFGFTILYTIFAATKLWFTQANGYSYVVDSFIKYNNTMSVLAGLATVILGMSLSANILASAFIYKPNYKGFKILNGIGILGTASCAYTIYFLGSVGSKQFETFQPSLLEILLITLLVVLIMAITKGVHTVADNIELTHRIQKLDMQIEIFEKSKSSEDDEKHLQNLYALKKAVEAEPTSNEHKLALKSVITINEGLLRQ